MLLTHVLPLWTERVRMRSIQLIFILLFWIFTFTGACAMELNDALAMVQTWISESKASERDIAGSLKVNPRGEFEVRVKGAIFRYIPKNHELLVSGLVGYDLKSLGLFPEEWKFLVRTGQRERTTMMYGEADFELLRRPIFDLEPDVVLLTKRYAARITDGRLLSVQIRWLLSDADYWFVNRYNEIMGKREDELIKEAPGINEWMSKNRPRPW